MHIGLCPTADMVRDLESVFAQHEPLRVRYERNELICQVDSYVAGVYLVTSGIVQESYRAPGTREGDVSLGLLGSGSLIGLEHQQLDGGQLHRSTCRAVSQVQLLFLERAAFSAAIEEHALLREFLTAHLAERCFAAARALWRSRLDRQTRFATLLLDLIPFGLRQSDDGIAMPEEIDLRLLAAMAHTTPRQARRVLAALPGVKWVEERLVYTPEELLRSMSEGTGCPVYNVSSMIER
jgi:CRP-like cAMP-binding protein